MDLTFSLPVSVLEEFGPSKEKLDAWRQEQISILQGEHSDDPETLEAKLNAMESDYEQRLQALKDEYSIDENYEQEKQVLQDEYWRVLQALEQQKKDFIVTQVKEFGLSDEDARHSAEAEFDERGRKIDLELQTKFDALRHKYNIPPGEMLSPKSLNLEEGLLDDWWERLQELWNRYFGETQANVEKLIADTNNLKRQVYNLERVLRKKEQDGGFANPMSEGWLSWTKYLNIPGFFWRRVYLRWLETRFGWLRDKFWARHVKAIDPRANPSNFVTTDPKVILQSKDDFTAVFFATLTIAFLLAIVKLTTIPIVAELIAYLYGQAKVVILGLL